MFISSNIVMLLKLHIITWQAALSQKLEHLIINLNCSTLITLHLKNKIGYNNPPPPENLNTFFFTLIQKQHNCPRNYHHHSLPLHRHHQVVRH